MRRSLGMTLLLGSVLAVSSCKKGDEKAESAKNKEGTTTGDKKAPDDTSKGKTGEASLADTAANADPGVEAGGIERDKDEGPAAVITAVEGTVEVRRVGETEFQAAKANTDLFPGDQVRTTEGATATITMADESVVEVAEVSTVAIASREGSADPASSAAVLGGLARFTVQDRAPGEGAFKVYTPAGVVVTKGTVYAVGVAASGEARVGVESGTVDLIGLVDMAAEPIVVEANHSATFTAEGSAGQPVEWASDDWGTWRTETDAEMEVNAVVTAHGTALADIGAELAAAYADLEATAETMAEFEAQAATHADATATAEYEAIAPEGAATIEASFGVAGHIEALTWAYAGHAALATDVYVRHPDTVKAEWEVVAPRVETAVLWPKRFVVTADAYLEPLRVQYYVHHPRGRAHAELVGVAVPEFYYAVNVPEPEPAKVRAKVRTKVWIQPTVFVRASARPVWISHPRPNWRAKVKVRPATYRAKASWYVRPPDVKVKVFLGADVKAKYTSKIVVRAPEPRATVRAKVKIKPVGVRIKVKAPDLDAAAKARVKVKIGGDGRVIVRDHRDAGVKVKGGAGVVIKGGGDAAGGVDVKVRDHRDDVKGKVDIGAGAGGDAKVKVRDHRDDAKGKVGAGADVKAKVKVKAPDVKVKIKAPPPPKVKVKAKGEVKAKGGIKIGN
jgi:hypothetical protein